MAKFGRLTLEAWNSYTGEGLDFRDARVTMLGDWPGGCRECTEEPWRVLHAVAVDIVLKTAQAAKYGQSASAQVLLCTLRRRMAQEMYNRRLRLRGQGAPGGVS